MIESNVQNIIEKKNAKKIESLKIFYLITVNIF
jgi:hypothetical protein